MLRMDEISDRIEGVIGRSPADETEIVWIEKQSNRAQNRKRQIEIEGRSERTILVRVIDRKRVGSHRTGIGEPSELDSAVRAAIAQSRSRDPLPGLLHFSADDSPIASDRGHLWDPAIAGLERRQVEALFDSWKQGRASSRLDWVKARIAVLNNRGIRRTTGVTSVGLETRISPGPGAGRAVEASRFLDRLEPERVVERAKRLHVSGDISDLPELPTSLVLSPEATAELVDILNRVAFSAVSYYSGSSFLREHLDVQVFDRSINLRDDADDPQGLPFPFDLEGSPKRPIHLILKGSPKTPALDQRQAARLGLSPTGHAIGGNDARAMNLFLDCGDLADSELIRAVGQGLWVGWLDNVECFEPSRVQVRATAKGVRRIEDGELSSAVPDLIWEDSLLRAFSNLIGIGSSAIRRLSPDGVLGGISAPSMAFSGVTQLRVNG